MIRQSSGIAQMAIGSIMEFLGSEGSAWAVQGDDYESQLSDGLSPPEDLVDPGQISGEGFCCDYDPGSRINGLHNRILLGGIEVGWLDQQAIEIGLAVQRLNA